jgi:hypothetical protein
MANMKLIMESWRKLNEGDVIEGPWGDLPPKKPQQPIDRLSDDYAPGDTIANKMKDLLHFEASKMFMGALRTQINRVIGHQLSQQNMYVEDNPQLHSALDKHMDNIERGLDEILVPLAEELAKIYESRRQ